MKIGCIGQGFVGKNLSDNLETRGYSVVRYSLDEEYKRNASQIADCDIVYIAVPTPSTPAGFDYSIVENVLSLVGVGKIAVIKSTLLPGTTHILQSKYVDRIVLFSPEFLSEKTAAYDIANPIVNVVGIPIDSEQYRSAAETVLSTMPVCEFTYLVNSSSAELYKYAHNLNGYFRVILANLLHDLGETAGAKWSEIKPMMDTDAMMSPFYNEPIHNGGRGAGGNCFIKDMAAFRHMYESTVSQDKLGLEVLRALEKKNRELLDLSNKSQDLLKGVYGE
jgi:UDP-glucose 6-dehydrogenase